MLVFERAGSWLVHERLAALCIFFAPVGMSRCQNTQLDPGQAFSAASPSRLGSCRFLAGSDATQNEHAIRGGVDGETSTLRR